MKTIDVFRQSKITRYVNCPRSLYLEEVVGMEQESTNAASIAGTTAHKAVEMIETTGREISRKAFAISFDRRLAEEAEAGKEVSVSEEQRDKTIDDHMTMIENYLRHPIRKHKLLLCEHPFTLMLAGKYPFVGTIDQLWLVKRDLVVVDLKFGAEVPSGMALDLNYQLRIYSYAVECGDLSGKEPLHDFRQRMPKYAAILKARDLIPYKKNQFSETIGRGNKKLPNPKFRSGYKIGDWRGKVLYPIVNTKDGLANAMHDVRRICAAIKMKQFFRRPDNNNCYMCGVRDACRAEIEIPAGKVELKI